MEQTDGQTDGRTDVHQRSRKRVQQLKKRKKSCFLDFEKNFKKRAYSNIQLPKVSTGNQSINQSRFFYSGLSNLNHCEVH